MQLGAAGARRVDGGRASAALRSQNPVTVCRMPRLRAHLLGRDPLATHARGARRALRNVLQRLSAGELTEDEALTELRRIQLAELGGRARLDRARFNRR